MSWGIESDFSRYKGIKPSCIICVILVGVKALNQVVTFFFEIHGSYFALNY